MQWHTLLFPTGYDTLRAIKSGQWRDDALGPMQVVSGPMGRGRVHFEAPAAADVPHEMQTFLSWVNKEQNEYDNIVKAALAHLRFITIHPFDDGNGRIARSITDMLLARADGTSHRYYSLSAQIQTERNAYYDILERTQRGDLDVTQWLLWFIKTLQKSIARSDETLNRVITKSRFWKHHQGVALNARQIKMLNLLLDGFEGKITTSKWARITKCSADTALRDINELVLLKMLSKSDEGGRSTGYSLVQMQSE